MMLGGDFSMLSEEYSNSLKANKVGSFDVVARVS